MHPVDENKKINCHFPGGYFSGQKCNTADVIKAMLVKSAMKQLVKLFITSSLLWTGYKAKRGTHLNRTEQLLELNYNKIRY